MYCQGDRDVMCIVRAYRDVICITRAYRDVICIVRVTVMLYVLSG